MLPISVCLIAKNEEKYIKECLDRLSVYPWEIILVDTGSTDHTVSLASSILPQVHHFEWRDDFSAARNYAISKASHDWILSADCDEMLETENKDTDIAFLQTAVSQKSPANLGRILVKNPCYTGDSLSFTHERISRFFHRDTYSFSGIIHEQMKPRIPLTPHSFDLPLSFRHLGYQDPDIRKAKAMRNITLLEKELLHTEPDPYLYFQMGQSYFAVQDMEKAVHYFTLGLSMDVNPKLPYVQTMVESYGNCLLSLHYYEQALQFENIYEEFCHHADFVFLMGLIYMNNAMFDRAIEEFDKATAIPSHSVDGVNSYKAYYNIGVIYECTGRFETAREYYRKSGEYPPALTALKRIAPHTGGTVS